MGNITDRPKAPKQQIVYVQQPVYTPNPSTPSSGNDNGTPSPQKEEEIAKQREKSLLARSRSRLGTILTGFRGLLTPVETGNQRKTLLGE